MSEAANLATRKQNGYIWTAAAAELLENATASDLSSRAQVFRARLIEEFRLDDTVTYGSKNDPKFSTAELFSEEDTENKGFKALLKTAPMQVVKFKIFKRTKEGTHTQASLDKRYTRVRSQAGLAVSLWAKWISDHNYFTGLVFALIVCNAIIQGLQTEMSQEKHHEAYDVMTLFDDITLVVFSIEILLKWMDSFTQFWTSGWNVFDFFVTVLSAIPRLIALFVVGSSSDSTGFGGIGAQLRLFRTLRILKMVARIGSLKVVVTTVIEAFQSLGFILLLLLLLSYIFGIFAINLFLPYTESTDPGLRYQDKFVDLPRTFVTLFQLLTLDQWYSIQKDVRKVVQPLVVICFFVCWVWIGAFIFRNVFVGVMVRKFDERSKQVRKDKRKEKRRAERRKEKQNLKQGLREQEGADGTEKTLARCKTAATIKSTKDLKTQGTAIEKWQAVVESALLTLSEDNGKEEFRWPRDTLLKYLRTMERLQNNMKEYSELQYLASAALHQVYEPD